MIGNTPFTSLHISHWKNYKKCDDEKRDNMDVYVSVMLCFGPRNSSPENPRFYIPKKGSVPFKHNQVFIHFPQRDGPLHIKGNPKLFWLFTFQIERSVIQSILKLNENTWFQDITIRSIKKCKIIPPRF